MIFGDCHLDIRKYQLSIKLTQPAQPTTATWASAQIMHQKHWRTHVTHLKTCAMATTFALVASVVVAGTDLETAINNGGEMLDSGEIAELIVGKVVTAKSGEKEFRFFYDPSNVLEGELTNGGWKGTGTYAITDNNQVCVSMAADKGRYRCLTAVRVGETVQKFNVDGEMTFELLGFEPSSGL